MTAPTLPDQALANLRAMPDDTFRTLIEGNLGRERQPRLWGLLLSPGLVDRTSAVLSALHRDIEDQLAEQRADMDAYRQECFADGQPGKQRWFQAQGEHSDWKRRALGYRRLVSTRLAETKQAKISAPGPQDPERKVRQLDTVFRLAWAIDRHRGQCLAAGIIPDQHDVDLWRHLDAVLVDTTDDGQMTVAQFLDGITSKPGFTPPPPPTVADLDQAAS